MASKGTDRKAKTSAPVQDAIQDTFKLPESLPCSVLEFPVLVNEKVSASWQDILEEAEAKVVAIREHQKSKTEVIPKSPFQRTECDYMRDIIFPYVVPALEETLTKAKIWNALENQKCLFNGIDHVVQVLWNNNPKYPSRKTLDSHVFNMHWVRKELENNPRPYYPKSWLWPEDYAAKMIQKTVRRYFVLCDEEVEEMREFWKKLKIEHEVSDIEMNPLLAKKFALHRKSTQH